MPIHNHEDPSLISCSSSKAESKYGRLKSKVQKLSDDNTKLVESLEQKNAEVTSLNDRIAKLTNSINSLTLECSSVSTAKVAELSKQNRRITAELQQVKSKYKKMEESRHDLEQLLEEKHELLQSVTKEAPPPAPSEVQVLTEKLERSKQKTFEVLNQNTQLKNELKMAHKCLQQEIGENVNISQLLSGSSNWRGRSQQIAMLNSKITDLKEKFETTSYDSFDEGSRLPLKRLESMRRMEVDSLSKELEECKSQLDDVKQKSVALKTRNKNLSDDANNYKLKTLQLMEKSSRDEEFINCLNEQTSMLKFEYNHKLEEMKKEVVHIEKLKQDSDHETRKLECQLQNQEELMNEKDNEIGNLKIAIEQLENNLREMSGDFLFSCRQMGKDEYMTLLKNLEEEKSNLLGFMRQLNERLDKESVKVSEQHDTINKQRLKISRLEVKLREMESEKEAVKAKNRRSLRISEYSRSSSHASVAESPSNERFTSEIDKYKFKLEVAMERIEFLEKKIKDQNEERDQDNQRFMEIIGKSKEIFKGLFDKDGNSAKASEFLDTTIDESIAGN